MSRDFSSMRRRICAWDLDPRRLDSVKPLLERHLRFLPQIDWYKLKTLDDPQFLPCDLLVVYAWHLGDTELLTWLQGFEARLKKQGAIWVPALIVSPVELTTLTELMEQVFRSNWYFDLIHPDHFNSIPVRVANLLRIHDHLHELKRYEGEVSQMQENIKSIESALAQLQGKNKP